MEQPSNPTKQAWMQRVKGPLFLVAGLGVGLALGLLIFFGGPGSGSNTAGDRRLPPTVGSAVEDFRLQTLDGALVSLSDLRGRPVLINFWATWCPPCLQEMPLLEKTAQAYGDRLVVVGINYAEDQQAVKSYVQEVNIQFPILLDQSGAIADRYFVRSFPASFFVDGEGILRAQHLGELTEDVLNPYLETIGIRQ